MRSNKAYEGETIEEKVRRITTTKEPINDRAEVVYTERKEGVLPDYDIRSDKWEAAVEAMDKVAQAHVNQRKKPEGTKVEKDPKEQKNDGGAEPIQGTGNAGEK